MLKKLIQYIPKKWELYNLRKRFGDKRDGEYYKELMKLRIKYEGAKSSIGFDFDRIGKLQFVFLKEKGLKPEHTLLDIGCGCLRGGVHFIDYLNKFCYSGCDISQEIIDAAKAMLKEKKLEDKTPSLWVNTNLRFEQVKKPFDFILAQSVFSHLPKKDLEECFAHMKKLFHKSTLFYATFFSSESYMLREAGCDVSYTYPVEYMQSLCKQYGFTSKVVEYAHGRGQTMLEIKKAK